MRVTDRYGSDVLSTDWRAPKRGRAVDAVADLGTVVEEVMTDFCGEIVAVDRDLHTLTLHRLDPVTGAVTTVISETGSTRVEPNQWMTEPPIVRVLTEPRPC